MRTFSELIAATNFSFLRGASPAHELVLWALLLGYKGIGIADRNTVAGIVRAYAALKELQQKGVPAPIKIRDGSGPGEYTYEERDGPKLDKEWLSQQAKAFKLVVGSRLAFIDGTPDIVVYPENRAGWARLCRLLTSGNLRAAPGQSRAIKGECRLTLDDLLADVNGLLLVVMPERNMSSLAPVLPRLATAAPGAVWIGATMPRRGDDRRRLARLKALAGRHRLPLLATNDALYAAPGERDLQDVLTCIREGTTIEAAGRILEANAERHLKTPDEMARLFADAPDAIRETAEMLSRIEFSLDQLKYEYPEEVVPPGFTPQGWLEMLVTRHAEVRYPAGIPDKVQASLSTELALIGRLDYARYFLTVYDIVRVANDKGILCQGRGSAANSAVCYVLGITAVDPAEHTLLFARFMSEKRKEPPDIDVDFEHERREEIIQHIYEKYGRERAGIAATVISYRPKSAIRDVGKVFGLSEDVTAALSSTQWGSWDSPINENRVRQSGLDPANPAIRRAVRMAGRLLGYPRHLSQHVGGFVLTRGRLDELVPIGNAAMDKRTFIEWDKDDIDTLELMKVDVLALGMLTCIRKALDFIREFEGIDWKLHDVPREDVETYDMLCLGDSIGVFQVESRAQMNMLPRLKPRRLYDLVIQVAIVRPGPIQGNMVHPYLKQRASNKPIEYPKPSPEHGDADELVEVLDKTEGVPLFQEQAMQLAMVAAKFNDDEANGLRRAMATFRNLGTIFDYETMMIERMVARGYERKFAEDCYNQIKGFGSYGFPESHAASFAKLVYISAYIKCHYPAIFAASLLNSQPMGFYAPAQIVRCAQEHGVTVRGVDVNHSDWDNTLEVDDTGQLVLRLGFRQSEGVTETDARRLIAARQRIPASVGGFETVEDVATGARLYGSPMRALADADAFRSIGLNRRDALWAIRRLPNDAPLPLFAVADARELGEEPDANLPAMSLGEHVATDYQTLRLSLKAHPMSILRPIFRRDGIASCAGIRATRNGAFARVAGLVLVRQRPGKGNAIFVTLEDETGITNVVLWTRKFETYRREVMAARLMLVEGRVQKSSEGVVHLMGTHVIDRSADLDHLWESHRSGLMQPKAEETIPAPLHLAPMSRHRHPRDVRLLPKSRDFH